MTSQALVIPPVLLQKRKTGYYCPVWSVRHPSISSSPTETDPTRPVQYYRPPVSRLLPSVSDAPYIYIFPRSDHVLGQRRTEVCRHGPKASKYCHRVREMPISVNIPVPGPVPSSCFQIRHRLVVAHFETFLHAMPCHAMPYVDIYKALYLHIGISNLPHYIQRLMWTFQIDRSRQSVT